ncbi:MAG: A/G-specific adenine glycosylase [Hyphomicrobiaceae bacterium]|nr:A/G-specific adenine glycosylase [Hyphomicrobiaceae bacterium]
METVAATQRQLPLRPAGPATVAALLEWYDAERRHLPWRAAPGRRADPYRVWLSEIMLQQTTVKVVEPYFLRFLARWSNVKALAAADLDDVLSMWAGLGYYTRARKLHECARTIVEHHGGRFPRTAAALIDLPGIGPYTAAAIAAIAFGERATPVDGNIERVVSRLFAVTAPLPKSKPEIRRLAATLTPADRPGDYAQAMMDLGARICMPKSPSCLMCPIQQDCHGLARGFAASLPRRAAKPQRPTRSTIAFLALSEDGHILLRQRPPRGLLGGMLEVPSTAWNVPPPPPAIAIGAAPIQADWVPVSGRVEHTFTHFRLEIDVLKAIVPADAPLTFWAEAERCRWVARRDLDRQALPSVMRKIIAHALPHA